MDLHDGAPINLTNQASMNVDRDKLRLAADEASDFLEFLFFLLSERMVSFVIAVELSMSVKKGVARHG